MNGRPFTWFVFLLAAFALCLPAGFAQKSAPTIGSSPRLHLPARKKKAPGGMAFARSISDSSLSLADREKRIFKAFKSGNIPGFLRKPVPVRSEMLIDEQSQYFIFYALPDYLAIGSDTDYVYMPMTPILAQRIAKRWHLMLPTRKMVDLIYENAAIKLAPLPIPPTKAMTSLAVFIRHNAMVQEELRAAAQENYETGSLQERHRAGVLTAGNKKDIVISPKIYTESQAKVVIYGWHQLNGKAIQPLYNKHSNLWADYSHGIRLIGRYGLFNGKKVKIAQLLADPEYHVLLSDEGIISRPFYPILPYR